MTRIPFGVSRLDSRFGGGAPRGSLVLLAGEAGAGARELLYTSAAVSGLAIADPELFDLHYGDLHPEARLPESIHYLSFTATEPDLQSEMAYTMDPDIVEAGLEAVEFADLSAEYFQLSPVPREWYADGHTRIDDIGRSLDSRDVITALADYLDAHAGSSLLLVDSLTDLIGVVGDDVLSWRDIVFLLKGLRRATRDWDCLILVHVSREALSETDLGDLMTSVDGTLLFEWESGGNELARTMVVREFRGVLSQLEAEDIVRFETTLHDSGFDISDVRKIR